VELDCWKEKQGKKQTDKLVSRYMLHANPGLKVLKLHFKRDSYFQK